MTADAGSCPTWSSTLDTSRMGLVIHDRADFSDRMSICLR